MLFSFFFFTLLSSSFAKEISSTNALEVSDLTDTQVPRCLSENLDIKPLCRFTSSHGYLTFWEVRNNKKFRCRETGNFSELLEDQNIPQEWNPGLTRICGAYWSGNQKLSLKISNVSSQMTLEKNLSCTNEQVKNIYSLCRLSVLPSTLQSFTASFDKDLKCVNVKFKTTPVDDDLTATIERSLDGNRFEDLISIASTVKSKGNYSYYDCSAKKTGAYFYRIRQRDHKGAQKTYGTIQILMPESVSELQLSKIAIKENLIFSIPNSKVATLELYIYDQQGNLVDAKSAKLEPLHQVVNLKVRRYPSGSYILKIKGDKLIHLGRFIKE